ncbi:MAG: alanine--tRNA ligase-related protein [Candidatus Faecousia sp.]|nr:alanine--tRNA ligase-related protein [Candidatus Faecousia sp.]
MATKKLYYEDSHLGRFSARVISCVQTDKGFEIILDATAFYPEGGGQAADTGILGGASVLDTRERGEEIIHLCDRALEPGSQVEGQIDWEPRFQRMQQHSGEHIVSGILHRRYGCSNTGFHMGQERTVIDFDGVIPAQALPEIEAEANRAVWANLPVTCWYPTPEELPSVNYRSKRALPWPVRIVEFPGYDCCACCGTHVKSTGEIGIIKLYSAVPFRGGTRIEMACGKLALSYLNRVLESSTQAGHVFSVPPEEVGTAAEAFSEQLAALKARIVELQRRNFAAIAREYENAGNVLRFEEGLDSTGLRELCDTIVQSCGGRAAVFSGEDGQGYGYCLAARQEDLRGLGKELTAKLNGRGGGKPNFQQGRINAARAEIEAFFAGR